MYEEMSKAKKKDTIRVVHLSDVHLDMKYKVGTEVNCGLPLCCREENGPAADHSTAAGHYGSYPCDIPETTVNEMLSYIRTYLKPHIVLWTGDSAPHDVWEETKAEVENSNLKVASMINEHLSQIA